MDPQVPSDTFSDAFSKEGASIPAAPRRRDFVTALRALVLDTATESRRAERVPATAMADVAAVLWREHFRHNPGNPKWADRDRFIMSDPRGMPLLYCLLHLSGYGLAREQLERFQNPSSEADIPGLELGINPPGHGLANAVGIALAEKLLADRYNRDGFTVVDHHTFVMVGQRCLTGGVCHEAGSLAGTLGLGKLIVLHVMAGNGNGDCGPVPTRENAARRFQAYGWDTPDVVDGHDHDTIRQAVEQARQATDRPSLLRFRVSCDYEVPGGDFDPDLLRESLDWPHSPFELPPALQAAWSLDERGERLEADWRRKFAAYAESFPDLAEEFERRLAGKMPGGWTETADAFVQETLARQTAMATRQASYNALNRYAPLLPELIGGSADLTPANKTNWKGSTPVRHGQAGGNHVNYGARELAMGSILAGLARHGGFIPFGGTFLMFCEYSRHAMWLSGIQRVPCIFQFTHDSIGLGEDGPTHQPIEQLASLRMIPGMLLWRPCDPLESALAWRFAIERRDGPSCLVFTRQTVPLPSRDPGSERNVHRGGYIIRDCDGTPEVIIVATGSEVWVATRAADALNARGRRARVVSMPCTQLFEAQEAEYQESVLPASNSARLVVEAGSTHGWHRYAGPRGRVLGLDQYGVSAPQEVLFEYFGFTDARVIEAAEALIDGASN